MKILIVYYSYSGNNERLSLDLKDRIGCDVHKISEIKKRKTISIMFDFLLKRKSRLSGSNIDVKDYDKIIFVAPIWGGKMAAPMRAFIESQSSNLGEYFFISICNGEVGQREKIIAELNTLVLHKPSEAAELWINNLLPEDKRSKIKHTFNYRVSKLDLEQFEKEIDTFIKLVNHEG